MVRTAGKSRTRATLHEWLEVGYLVTRVERIRPLKSRTRATLHEWC